MAGAVLDVSMTSTLSCTTSVAISVARSVRPSAQRYSIMTLRLIINRNTADAYRFRGIRLSMV